jgi:metal-responsive CopG/Arc/MetJ family transcriptional regulator
MTEYTTVRLPKELMNHVDTFIQTQNLGYTSRAEVVKDAVRDFLSKMKGKGEVEVER